MLPLRAGLAHKFSISESLTRCIRFVDTRKAERRRGSRGQASPVGVRSEKFHKCVAHLFVGGKPNESVSASGLLFQVQWQLDKLESSQFCLSKAFDNHVRPASDG